MSHPLINYSVPFCIPRGFTEKAEAFYLLQFPDSWAVLHRPVLQLDCQDSHYLFPLLNLCYCFDCFIIVRCIHLFLFQLFVFKFFFSVHSFTRVTTMTLLNLDSHGEYSFSDQYWKFSQQTLMQPYVEVFEKRNRNLESPAWSILTALVTHRWGQRVLTSYDQSETLKTSEF